MPSTMVTVEGFPVPVDVTGPDKGSVVVVLGAAHHAPAAYDAVCQRLHTASLRTIVIGPDRRLTAKSVVGILDALEGKRPLLVGDRACAGPGRRGKGRWTNPCAGGCGSWLARRGRALARMNT